MKLYVIRHGETDVNVKGQVNGHNTIGLNENGIKQAKEASLIIRNLDIDLIFCSPLVRTKETCYYVNTNNIEVIYDSRLVERDGGSLDQQSVLPIDWNLWYDYSKEIVYKDTEGFKSVYDRISEFLDWLKTEYKNQNILLVTHGDVYKAIYLYFNPALTVKEIIGYHKANCEIGIFEL